MGGLFDSDLIPLLFVLVMLANVFLDRRNRRRRQRELPQEPGLLPGPGLLPEPERPWVRVQQQEPRVQRRQRSPRQRRCKQRH